MSARDSREAWSGFWAAGGAGPASGCLPNALQAIDSVQRNIWQEFACGLRRRADVLDLATGDGAVPAKMLAARADLRITGVDSSPVLPPAPRGVKLISSISMERLPFPDASFDAVSSQFGFEYGDTRKAASQVSRVLRRGGLLRFIVHHRAGPILAHNLSRGAALRWALTGGYLEKARAFVRARNVAPLPTPTLFRQAPVEGRRLFPNQTVAAEFTAAILQTLDLSRNAPAREAIEVLDALEKKADNELARIEALKGAARDAAQLERLIADLRSAGLIIQQPVALREQKQGVPFAWLLTGARDAVS